VVVQVGVADWVIAAAQANSGEEIVVVVAEAVLVVVLEAGVVRFQVSAAVAARRAAVLRAAARAVEVWVEVVAAPGAVAAVEEVEVVEEGGDGRSQVTRDECRGKRIYSRARP
jgi:hypothetical protein